MNPSLIGLTLLTNELIWSVVAIVAIAALLAILYVLWDRRRENCREKAIDCAEFCRDAGMHRVALFFREYGTGDYSGALRALKELARLAASPEERAMELNRITLQNVVRMAKETASWEQLKEAIETARAGRDVIISQEEYDELDYPEEFADVEE